jgi:hypothetical protein
MPEITTWRQALQVSEWLRRNRPAAASHGTHFAVGDIVKKPSRKAASYFLILARSDSKRSAVSRPWS